MTNYLKKTGSRPGTRDLSIVAQQVHAPRQPRIKQQELTSLEETQSRLEAAEDSLLLAAGDQPGRSTFFGLDDSSAPRLKAGRKVHLVLERGAALPDYRTRQGKRNHRSMVTLPPMLRQSIQEIFGAADGEDFPFTTALIALADYGAMALKRDDKMLVVSPAEDPQAEERKLVRTLIRRVGLKQ
ncbi:MULTISPECIES: hypothetical protein [unclassified Stenotrophomonas]|uniref:hypothetical protein n=1 Tax=unclassified Stenotrophomonas TaxID=196198 RepID=UPI002449930D|nr:MULTISPECIES: hypothetical protein [unclassified Stenotrophomonas]MDG9843081.1 hypothetical protein [Stenotrophomonas sp. GD04054]MDH0015879.1 hypothetical protein [Stenotrophomonas sp. GD04028]MDH0575663.1 hypothetical protein [Stenotrophomonas sp. GD03997]MDH0859583.1 hypothetical protein [Stenotrophomonas sp. GD03882]